MNTLEAKKLALNLMEDHGVSDWALAFDMSESALGSCSPKEKKIRLSVIWTKNNPEKTVKNTILHEISHALDWKRNGHAAYIIDRKGHGPSWKKIAIELGASPNAICYSAKMEPLFELYNKDTGEVYQTYSKYPTQLAGQVHKHQLKYRPSTLGKLRIRRIAGTGEWISI